MRADRLDELKRLLGDLRVEMQSAFVSVLEVVEVTPDRELDVAACDNLTAQDRVTIAANTGCMVSECHAGDVDSSPCVPRKRLRQPFRNEQRQIAN